MKDENEKGFLVNHFPNEILMQIFLYIMWDDIYSLRLTCSHFLNLIESNSTQRALDFRRFLRQEKIKNQQALAELQVFSQTLTDALAQTKVGLILHPYDPVKTFLHLLFLGMYGGMAIAIWCWQMPKPLNFANAIIYAAWFTFVLCSLEQFRDDNQTKIAMCRYPNTYRKKLKYIFRKLPDCDEALWAFSPEQTFAELKELLPEFIDFLSTEAEFAKQLQKVVHEEFAPFASLTNLTPTQEKTLSRMDVKLPNYAKDKLHLWANPKQKVVTKFVEYAQKSKCQIC